jgi:hypothetical protein
VLFPGQRLCPSSAEAALSDTHAAALSTVNWRCLLVITCCLRCVPDRLSALI